MSFQQFIETAWSDHADHADAVAQRLTASLAQVEEPAQVAPYARLVTHVFGEHLAQWQDGLAVLAALRALPAAAGPVEQALLARNGAVLRHGHGDADAVAALGREDRIVALATASSAYAAQKRYAAALDAYESAEREAEGGLPAGSPAVRALAVGGNNLASALEEKAVRDARETAGMVAAAQSGLVHWRQAGTWLEEERAHYRLARSLLKADRAADAVGAAQSCVDVCLAHDAPPFERFFGYAVLSLALRGSGRGDEAARAKAQALAEYEQVADDERTWCAADLAELAA
jgi:hypothetical protein